MQVFINDLSDETEINFYMVASKEEYDELGTYLNSLKLKKLLELGFTSEQSISILRNTYKMYFNIADTSTLHKNIILTIDFLINIEKLIILDYTVPDVLKDFQEVLVINKLAA